MKSWRSSYLLSLLGIFQFFSYQGISQVTVNSTAGLSTANYATLKAAFDGINNGIHQGVINIFINGSTTETATATLNAPIGLSSYLTVKIQPTVTATISGSIAGPLIYLNGANSFTIDGRIGGLGSTRSLTIENTYSGNAAAAYAIQSANNASPLIVRYCVIAGQGQQNFANATISFGANSFSKIDNNEVRPVPNGWQTRGIVGGDSIINNLVHDFYNPTTVTSSGFPVGISGGGFISGNSLYHTDTVFVTNPLFTLYYINGGSIVKSNYIGGTQPLVLGNSATFVGNQNVIGIKCDGTTDSNTLTNIKIFSPGTSGGFTGISASGVSSKINGNIIGSLSDTSAIQVVNGNIFGISPSVNGLTTSCIIQNNKIGGLTVYGTGNNSILSCIQISGFDTSTIINNTVGSPISGNIKLYSPAGELRGISLMYTINNGRALCTNNYVQELKANFSGSGSSMVSGIYNNTQGDSSRRWITNNNITNLTGSNSSGDVSLNGIYSGLSTTTGSPSLRNFIKGNTISALSITAGGAASSLSGIRNESPFKNPVTIDSNFINGLSSAAADTASLLLGAVQGIGFFNIANNAASITRNVIYDLSSISSFATSVTGINAQYNNNTFQMTIGENRIYDLKNDFSNTANIAGIMVAGAGSNAGNFLIKNNMISLSPLNTPVNGIINTLGCQSLKAVYNSVLISGTAAASNTSSAFQRVYYSNSQTHLQNNVFINLRTGGSGNHYSITNASSNPATGWQYSDYNDLYTSNTNTTALWGSISYNLSNYQVASQKDLCSILVLPSFTNSTIADLHLPNNFTNQQLTGRLYPAVTKDFDGDTRPKFPTMGADELSLPYQGITITSNITPSLCSGGSVILISSIPSGIEWYKNGILLVGMINDSLIVSQAGAYTAVHPNGCISDTSNVINVVAGPAISDSFTVILCAGQTYQFGQQVLSVPGQYRDTFISSNQGCDSIVTIKLNTLHLIDTIKRVGNTYVAIPASSYQWVDCDQGYSPVAGATGQVFTPPINHGYAVIITLNNCIDTSECIEPIGIDDVDINKPAIYPNPGKDKILISFRGTVSEGYIRLLSIEGKTVREVRLNHEKKAEIETIGLPNGAYFLEINKDGSKYRSQWMKM
jgi:hypothetical protein